MKYKQVLKIRKTEKDPQVRDRILLNVLVERDGMSVTGAALHLGMAPSWALVHLGDLHRSLFKSVFLDLPRIQSRRISSRCSKV